MAGWSFYGRKDELNALERILGRGRWFFVKITGRRRIGKTRLIEEACAGIGSTRPVFSRAGVTHTRTIPQRNPAHR